MLKRCTGLIFSTPQHIINLIFGEWSVSERALFSTAKEWIKAKVNPSKVNQI